MFRSSMYMYSNTFDIDCKMHNLSFFVIRIVSWRIALYCTALVFWFQPSIFFIHFINLAPLNYVLHVAVYLITSLFRPFIGLAYALIVESIYSKLSMIFPTFYLEYKSTVSILQTLLPSHADDPCFSIWLPHLYCKAFDPNLCNVLPV